MLSGVSPPQRTNEVEARRDWEYCFHQRRASTAYVASLSDAPYFAQHDIKIRYKKKKHYEHNDKKTHERCRCTDILRMPDCCKAVRSVLALAVIVHGIGNAFHSRVEEFDSHKESAGEKEDHPLAGTERKPKSEEKKEKVRCQKDANIPLGL